MLTLSTSLPILLLKQAQSARLSLPKRLRALGEMAQGIDQSLTVATKQIAVGHPITPLTDIVDVAALLTEAAQLVHAQLLPRIKWYRVQIANMEQLTEAQRSWLWQYFQRQIYPLLTPSVVDSGHPFPYLQSRRLSFLVVLQSNIATEKEKERYGLVQIPARLPRLIQVQPCSPLPANAKNAKPMRCLVWREEIVRHFLPTLFSGVSMKAVYQFRLLRTPQDSTPATFVAAEQQGAFVQGPVIRLDVEKAMPLHLRQWLIGHLQIRADQALACATPLGLADLCELADHLTPQ